MTLKCLRVIALLICCSQWTFAADAPSASADPALEKRVMVLSEELRCLVCQNQTIADSHAELAVDLRNQIRDLMRKGQSDQQIKEYMVQRYGEFVLYRPSVKGNTWLLWGGPFVLLIIGVAFLVLKLRQRSKQIAADSQFSPESQRRAEALLGGNVAASQSQRAKDKE